MGFHSYYAPSLDLGLELAPKPEIHPPFVPGPGSLAGVEIVPVVETSED